MPANSDDTIDRQNRINETIDGLLRIQRLATASRESLNLFVENGRPPEPPLHSEPLETAQRQLKLRRHRDAVFSAAGYGGIFGEPGWDMLLDLYIAWKQSRKISVSSICIAAAVPPTTALRHLSRMLQLGLATRRPDPDDSRRVWIELTDTTVDLMRALLSSRIT